MNVKRRSLKTWDRVFMDESHYDELIDESVTLINETGEPLLVLLKGAIHPEIGGYAWQALKKINLKSRNRGTAAGRAGEVFEGETQDGKTRTGKTLQSPRGWDVVSGIVGYFERTVRMPWCRACAWNKRNPQEFEKLGPVLRACTGYFQEHVPRRYAVQKAACEKTHPDFVIPGTVYTTLTVNKTFRTAAHLDVGDLAEGFSNMFVIKQGAVKGGHLVLPAYRIAVKLDNLDFVMFDAHEYHGNTQIITGKDGVRCSVVCYYRTKMKECLSSKEEFHRVKNRKRGEKLFENLG
jgi:hypothetical protein